MIKLIKDLWMSLGRLRLKRKHVYLSDSALFNNQTIFGGYNKVGHKAVISNTILGRFTYVGSNTNLHSCIVGSFSSISHDISIESYTHPSQGFISTSPVFFSILNQCGRTFVKGAKFEESLSVAKYRCIIGNDVWVGSNVKIMGGITIGNGAIVAMGAVVTKDVPPYAIVGGVPAKVIRYRYTQEQINKLENYKWWDKDDLWLQQHADLFSNEGKFFNMIDNE